MAKVCFNPAQPRPGPSPGKPPSVKFPGKSLPLGNKKPQTMQQIGDIMPAFDLVDKDENAITK